jgi:hypothetical protein
MPVRLVLPPVKANRGGRQRRAASAGRIARLLGAVPLSTILAVLGLVGLWGLAILGDTGEGATPWEDGSRHGDWIAVFDGYGETTTRIDGTDQVISLAPQATADPGTTHAALVVTATHYSDVHLSVDLRTVQQLRTPDPAPWEVGWVLWNYTDPAHFYAFVLKPNGWELSKRDPAYAGGQRFLASGETPQARLTTWHSIGVAQTGATITIAIDGVTAAVATDAERPYLAGAVGLYCEDSVVEFRRIQAGTGSP